MKERKLEFGVGVFILTGLVGLAYLTVKLGAGALVGSETYPLEARFANAGGVTKGGSVMIGGVPVGRVDGVRLDPQDFSAIVEMSILTSVKLPTDTIASVRTSGLIGDKFIALAPGADEDSLQANEQILMTESAVELESLISKMAFGGVSEESDAAEEEKSQ